MSSYAQMSKEQLEILHEQLQKEYDVVAAERVSLNMARGRPGKDQIDLSLPMLDTVSTASGLAAADGTDCGNYGVLAGLPEARQLMAEMMGCSAENVIMCGNSSLNIMFDTIARAELFGILGSRPWAQEKEIKFLCPVPGYDRHFRICETFGITMISVPLKDDGPDMDTVEELVTSDPTIKGIWCVPKYANPTGIVYSERTIKRFAALKPAAADFRIFWDNAYCVHHLYDEPEKQADIADILGACAAAGNPDMVYEFASSSKVTFPGAGIAAFAASKANLAETKKYMSAQTIGYDKINQLRHARFLCDAKGVAEHMRKHAALIRPKFEAVEAILERELGKTDIARWTHPDGGYFISFEGPKGSAKRIVAMAADAGVTLTAAGATWPYGKDPADSNIRIAPTSPPIDELKRAAHILTLVTRLVAIDLLLQK